MNLILVLVSLVYKICVIGFILYIMWKLLHQEYLGNMIPLWFALIGLYLIDQVIHRYIMNKLGYK